MGCVGETLVEYNTVEVKFEELQKDVLFELSRYIRNHVVEASSRKGHFNTWVVKFIKGHTGAIRQLYRIKEIGRGYRLEMY